MALLWYGSWDNQTKQQQKKENHSQIGQIHVLLVLMKFQEGIMNNDTPKSIVGLFFPPRQSFPVLLWSLLEQALQNKMAL